MIHDVIAIGGGVAGIYQIKKLIDNGFNALMLEANDDLGGTWFKNRYPGCRFDSESYSYGYSFSRELVNEWHWKERFSPQPENLKYLNFVADKFDLRAHMRFNAAVESTAWDEAKRVWNLKLHDGTTLTSRFVVTCVGVLSVPFLPSIDGKDNFAGKSFHTFDWPAEGIDLTNSRVGIIAHGISAPRQLEHSAQQRSNKRTRDGGDSGQLRQHSCDLRRVPGWLCASTGPSRIRYGHSGRARSAVGRTV